MKKEDNSPIFLDGVKEYHNQLNTSFNEALKLANRLVPKNLRRKDCRLFKLFVDFSEPQPYNSVKAYFVVGKQTIVRFINFIIDYAALFPVTNHWDNVKKNGITYDEIQNFFYNHEQVFLYFSKQKDLNIDYPIFDIKISEADFNDDRLKYRDDFGNPIYEFPDIQRLKLLDIPSKYLDHHYSLVEKQFYAPYTTSKPIRCVLYAELNNQYDEHAIKVLRWAPITRQELIDNILLENIDAHDIFFELGYISRQENIELHDFMVSNNSRLLFAEAKEDKLSIIGGVKIFLEKDFNFPISLYKIPFE